MIHRNQRVSFRNSEFPLSGGFLQSLLKTKYLNINIGELFESIAEQLSDTVGALKNSVDFSLVNVCSPFTKFSHGYFTAPPEQAWPFGNAIIFTFAVRAQRSRESKTKTFKSRYVRRPTNNVTRWGFDAIAGDFVSISFDMAEATRMGVAHSAANELQYIYNLIGAMTKSFVRRQGSYLPNGRSYEEHHSLLNMFDMYAEYYRMPLKQLFRTVPYHLWVFNYHIWEYAPNVLPQRTITPALAMYYFTYLNGVVPMLPRRSGDVTLTRLGFKNGTVSDDGIAGILSSSILNFVQIVKSPNDVQLSDDEILAPAVIDAFLRTGKTQLNKSRGYMGSAIQGMRNLIVDLQARENDLGSLFLPPDETARKLMHADMNWRKRINDAMMYPQEEILDPSDE